MRIQLCLESSRHSVRELEADDANDLDGAHTPKVLSAVRGSSRRKEGDARRLGRPSPARPSRASGRSPPKREDAREVACRVWAATWATSQPDLLLPMLSCCLSSSFPLSSRPRSAVCPLLMRDRAVMVPVEGVKRVLVPLLPREYPIMVAVNHVEHGLRAPRNTGDGRG